MPRDRAGKTLDSELVLVDAEAARKRFDQSGDSGENLKYGLQFREYVVLISIGPEPNAPFFADLYEGDEQRASLDGNFRVGREIAAMDHLKLYGERTPREGLKVAGVLAVCFEKACREEGVTEITGFTHSAMSGLFENMGYRTSRRGIMTGKAVRYDIRKNLSEQPLEFPKVVSRS